MSNDDFWNSVHFEERDGERPSRIGSFRVAMVFGLLMIALTITIVPMVAPMDEDQYAWTPNANIDYSTTAAIPKKMKRQGDYTLRRSVLQGTPDAICIINSNGSTNGNC